MKTQKNSSKSVIKPLIKILGSVAILVMCFFRKHVIPEDNIKLTALGTGITLVLILICFYSILTSVVQIKNIHENKKREKEIKLEQPIKIWTTTELCCFLEKEDIIDVVIDNGNALKVGTKSDYKRPPYGKAEYFDKCYYIDDEEYIELSEFKNRLLSILKDDTVKILYVGIEDMPVSI